MKKILYILLLIPFTFFGQNTAYIQQDSPLELSQGWNMFGFSCYEPMNLIDAFSQITDKVILVKDNDGSVYMPEFSFNGIGSLRLNLGYQIKLTEIITDFQFCPFIVPLIEGCMDETAFNYITNANNDDGSCIDVINGCTNALAFNYDSLANMDDGTCIPFIYGCTNALAFNYNSEANTDEGSCIYLGCTDSLACNYEEISNQEDSSCEYPLEEGFDCDGNPLINCFYPPDTGFVSWLQQNTLGVMNGDCLDIDAAGELEYINSIMLTNINNLNGIQYFTNLGTLYITNNQTLEYIPDMSSLNLSYLYIGSNHLLTNLPDFSGLDNLALLDIDNNNGITSIPTLHYLNNLTFLRIAFNNGLTSLPDLSGLMNLSSLDLNNNDALTSLSNLSDLTNLSTLNIYNNEGLECVVGYPEQLTIQEIWPPVCSSACPYDAFLEYSPDAYSYDYSACITPIVMGCMDSIAENYNIEANIEDNSCQYILGCMDNQADNFSHEATQEDGNCIYYGCVDSVANNYDLIANEDDGSCIYLGCMDELAHNYDTQANVNSGVCIYLGCIEPEADNFDVNANLDDGSCIYLGCNKEIAENYNSQATQDDGSCIILGCTNFTAENYFNEATQDDESCLILGCAFNIFPNYNSEATDDDGSCNMNSEDVFGCTDSLSIHYNDLANIDNGSCNNSVQVGDENFGGIVFYYDSIGEYGLVAAMEDIDGTFEWGCQGLSISGASGQSIGAGYQNTLSIVNDCSEGVIAASEALAYETGGYSDWFLPSKDELNEIYNTIGNGGSEGNTGGFLELGYLSSTESSINGAWAIGFSGGYNYGENKNILVLVRAIRSFGNWTMGCMDSLACNYNPEANMADGSCTYAEEGYDCDGNINVQVGDEAFGGIVFYVDSTGQHGLVGAMEEIEGTYEWGCYGTSITGADGQNIGTGYQNTLEIVSGCSETPIAASEALAYESEGYSDWFLPSINELSTMSTILSFSNNYYWSSSEYNGNDAFNGDDAWIIYPSNGYTGSTNKNWWDIKIRVIRAFGNWTTGCMDSLACNFNPEANMADNSCEYPQYYDCDGNILPPKYQVGDLAEGGIVFYIDETGQHGLVAALEDIVESDASSMHFNARTFDWGCPQTELSGADGTSIGTGLQNTLEIVSGCSQTPIAASKALAYESEGYSDWFLPSKDELKEMCNTIGNGGPEGNIGGFETSDWPPYYWSSSEYVYYNNRAWYVDFSNCLESYDVKQTAKRVRVIRAF